MKKFLISLIMVFAVIGVNAQTAIQTAKVLDNVYLGPTVGVTTPLDLSQVFPLNTAAGLKLGKEFTPVLALEVEGVALFNDNNWGGPKTFVKATNVGLNGILNLTNLFKGYKGNPRTLEFKTNTGIGWFKAWGVHSNGLTAKTGLDVQYNFGKTKAHSFVLTPAVYWHLNKFGEIKFDKRGGQLGLALSYLYHFKTSNGTRHFKIYDVGAMNDEISRLNAELAKKPKVVIREVVKTVESKPNVVINNAYIVSFAQGSYNITDAAKGTLDAIVKGSTVVIDATASPEGTEQFNLELSKNRANAVADYLRSRGVNVASANGLGVTGDDSQRVARILFK